MPPAFFFPGVFMRNIYNRGEADAIDWISVPKGAARPCLPALKT